MEKGLEIEKLRGQLQELQGRTVAEFTSHLSGLMERHVAGLQATAAPPLANGHVAGSRRDHGKRFVPRESLLTELFHISHIRTIYHIFVAMLVLLFTHAILIDMVEHGTLSLSPSLLVYAFGGVRVTAETWLLMFCSVIFLVYPTFHFWATHRSSSPVLFDWLFSSMFVAYCGCLLYLPAVVVMQHRLPPASSFIVLLEQIRLFMKVYAFVRSNVVRARAPETKDLDRCPNFSTFLLFMFVPTLVYRDSYPRTDRVRWGRVVLHLAQVVGCVVYTSFLLERFFLPPFQRYGLGPVTWRHLVVHVFGSVMPGMLCYLCGFFALLHAWMNAFAEMTRFADRMFYQDWWNVTNYASFYRTWNIVVHDWLYEYIYSDVVRYRGKLMATLAVFVVSSIVHEYTLMFVFNFFFPILFLQFGVFGVLLHFMNVRSAAGNVLLWITLSLGVGIDMTFYTAEWYARHNCPQIYDNVYADFFSSRALSCWSRNITEDVLGESTVPAPA
ncbi:sterol O-acyltransferase 1-like [Pollicipes pollicipes]|uniref:sterol O-acyltransferase 1-like n=1 Tax=Pollicipes pollicipes TaxID=41117 RepID=UPI0018849BD3|nr:sterol O-acyltransferase 1-like [Pollicipes pollicipes]XP_037075009.1 sterol O-acyltransferase 1-like [Pollicipes pollicipes]